MISLSGQDKISKFFVLQNNKEDTDTDIWMYVRLSCHFSFWNIWNLTQMDKEVYNL